MTKVSVADAQPTVLGQGEDEVPVVEYSLIVLEALGGVRVTGSQLTFRVPGGPYHGGHVTVPGAPRITVGDELLVTVEAIEGSGAHFTPRWEGGLFVRGTRADGATAVAEVSAPAGPVFTERPREVAMPWSDLLDEARLCAQTVQGEVAP